MIQKRLPYELRSLVHHVELNRSGWWDKALQQLILYVLWSSDGFVSADEVSEAISVSFSISVEIDRITDSLQILDDEGKVIENLGTYKITEEQRSLLEEELGTAEQIADEAKERFMLLVSEACPSIEPLECWDEFNQLCLLPLVKDLGARTYEFLINGTLTRELTVEDTDFFSNYELREREALRAVIVEYLSSNDAVVRDFMLRTLDSAFFLEASGLQVETLEKFASSGFRPDELILFLDTNLLFSVMALHDNPSNTSVDSLLNIIQEIADTISTKLYALPITLDEFRRTLAANRDDLAHLSMPTNVITAARLSQRFSGVKLRYFEKLQESNQYIDPAAYFDPYLSNPVGVLRENGVELFNEDTNDYRKRQDVIDGINQVWDSESKQRRTDTRYRAILHDMILWHFVQDRRPAYIESLSDAKSWVLTIDYGLLRFDRRFHNSNVGKPICIHPSLLVQMLRFWLPRDDNFETAVLDSLRIPFIFRSFNAESEKVTLRILQALTRFELGDISPATLTQILVDDAVNTGFRETKERYNENALIEHSLSEIESSLRAKIEEEVTQANAYRGTIEVQNEQIEQSNRSIDQEREKRRSLEAELERRETEESAKRTRTAFYSRWLVFPTVVTLVIVACIASYVAIEGNSVLLTFLTIGGAALVGILIVTRIVISRGRSISEVNEDRPYRLLSQFQGRLCKIAVSLLVAIAGTAIWDLLNNIDFWN